jgi:hypothetical protein
MLLKLFNFVSEISFRLRITGGELKNVTIMFRRGRICEKMHQVCIKCLRNRKEGLRRGEWGEGVYQSPIACHHKRSKKNQVRICSTNLKSLGMTTRNKEKQKGGCDYDEIL